MNQNKQTTVEEGTEFRGTLTSTCPVVVRGALDGEIQAPSLTVAATGSVVGHVRAQRIHSEGVLAGSVDADEVSLSGSVRSDTVIRAKTLEVKLSLDKGKLEVTFGECILEVGEEPQLHDAKAPVPRSERRPSWTPSAPPGAADEAEANDDMSGEHSTKKAEENGKRDRHSVPPAS